MSESLTSLSATKQSEMIANGEISAVELLEAHIEVIEKHNPSINAICTANFEKAFIKAQALDQTSANGHSAGPLHGLVVTVKDTHLTRGIRTTFGSPIYRDLIPNQSHFHVELIEDAGGVVIGKSNVPEFAAGSQTTNPIFGSTRNPYDLTKTSGGSSGGSAAALASGMASLADGSDMGGSLRNPASFCNVFGLRPTPGRVPQLPSKEPFSNLSVIGPMARTAKDLGLLLSVITQWNPRDPLSLKDPHVIYHPSNWISSSEASVKLAASSDLSMFPLEKEVRSLFQQTIERLTGAGLSIEWAEPNLNKADHVFRVLRGYAFSGSYGSEYASARQALNDDIVWNIEEGLKLHASDIYAAKAAQGELYRDVLGFFDDFDFLIMPTTQVLPFDVTVKYPTEIDGLPLNSYIDWMASCYLLSVLNMPVISVPASVSSTGLPFGIQILAKPGSEMSLLLLADKIDEILGMSQQRPTC